MRKRNLFPLVGLVLLFAGCTDDANLPTVPHGDQPPPIITMDVHADANLFQFLAPLGPAVPPGGDFVPDADARVEICPRDNGDVVCGRKPVLELLVGGKGPQQLNVLEAAYEGLWHVKPNLDQSLTYRISVFIGGVEVGYVDARFDATADYQLTRGERLPIRFWVGTPLEPPEPEPDPGLPAVRFSELDYDAPGTDFNEAIEIEGPAGTDLTGWSVVLYNGFTENAAVVYRTVALTQTIPDLCGGRGVVLAIPPDPLQSDLIQNGARDGMALVNAEGQVVELLSYEGTFTAADGPAAGMLSTDIGVQDDGAAAGFSLQRHGDGSWSGPMPHTLGACNFPDPDPDPSSYPVNVEYLWTDTGLMPQGSRMVPIPGTDDVMFGLGTTGSITTAAKRGAVTETGLQELWNYAPPTTTQAVTSADYDPLNNRVAWGGVWPDGRRVRVLDASDGAFQWATSSQPGSPLITVTLYDEFGRLWTAASILGDNVIQLYDADGTFLAGLATANTSETPAGSLAAAVQDGSGDVIMASATLMRRLSFDGVNINVVWSQVVLLDVDNHAGRPLLVANGQLHHGANIASSHVIQHRDLTDGSVIFETDWVSIRQNEFNVVKDLHVDERGDFWVFGSHDPSTWTEWDLIRFDPDWNIRTNWATDFAGHPMITQWTDNNHRPSAVAVTASGYVVMGAYSGFASDKPFRIVVGKLVNP